MIIRRRVFVKQSGQFLPLPVLRRLARRVMRTVSGSRRARGEVSVAVVGPARMAQLARARGKTHATDVLAFPLDPPLLGEIFLCPEEIAKRARQWGRTPTAHAAALFVHGMLHLLGYDHEREKDAKEMEGLEQKVLDSESDPH